MNFSAWTFLTTPVFQKGLIVVGVLLRLRHYLENRSFWQDEICLALSIVNRSWSEIWQHVLLFPDFAQAPLFFQLIEKSFVTVLGNSEMSLRFFPFLASVLALLLARRFFKRLLDPFAATIALACFALIDPLVYFAAELKPYGVDVLAALLVYEMFAWLQKDWTLRRISLFALGGALIIWLSNAMLFILAGGGIVLFAQQLLRRDTRKALILAGCFLVWIVSFILLYQLSLGKMLNPDLLKNWRLTGGFAPALPWTWDGALWFGKAFLRMFETPLGMGWSWGMAFFFLTGCYSLFVRDRRMFFFLLLPFFLSLFAGAFEKYPFFERLILFLVPSLLVVLAAGVRDAATRASVFRPWLGAVVIAAVLFYPVTVAAGNLFKPRGYEFNREAMEYLARHYQPGDLIAISPQAQYPFWYYGQRLGFNVRLPLHAMGEGLSAASVVQLFPDPVMQGTEKMLALRRTLSVYDDKGFYRRFLLMDPGKGALFVSAETPLLLKGMGRVWVFLSHHNTPAYSAFVNSVFSRAGRRLENLEKPGAVVSLYQIPGKD